MAQDGERPRAQGPPLLHRLQRALPSVRQGAAAEPCRSGHALFVALTACHGGSGASHLRVAHMPEEGAQRPCRLRGAAAARVAAARADAAVRACSAQRAHRQRSAFAMPVWQESLHLCIGQLHDALRCIPAEGERWRQAPKDTYFRPRQQCRKHATLNTAAPRRVSRRASQARSSVAGNHQLGRCLTSSGEQDGRRTAVGGRVRGAVCRSRVPVPPARASALRARALVPALRSLRCGRVLRARQHLRLRHVSRSLLAKQPLAQHMHSTCLEGDGEQHTHHRGQDKSGGQDNSGTTCAAAQHRSLIDTPE